MVKRLKRVADYVNTLSDEIEKLSDAELKAKTDEFRRRLADEKNPETLDELLPEAFDTVEALEMAAKPTIAISEKVAKIMANSAISEPLSSLRNRKPSSDDGTHTSTKYDLER